MFIKTKLFYALFILYLVVSSCTPKALQVAKPNYTLLKEFCKYSGGLLGNPNDENGHYIILNNNLQTYMSHTVTSNEVGIWRMRGDTLLLEPQLFTVVYGANPGEYVKCPDHFITRRYLMTKKYAYDITDYSVDASDSLYLSPKAEEELKRLEEVFDETREIMLIMQTSHPYKHQRSFEW